MSLKAGKIYKFAFTKLPRGTNVPVGTVPADLAAYPGEKQLMFNYKTAVSYTYSMLFTILKFVILFHTL